MKSPNARKNPKIALISQVRGLSRSQLKKAAGAFQKQVSRDFAAHWEIDATILISESVEAVPEGSWPVVIKKEIGVPGALAYHDVRDGLPFSQVLYNDGWTLSASHQILEMLACPFGNRFVASFSMKRGEEQKRVRYLVQVCDPCQSTQFAYRVDGVLVSDFYTPHYFDREATRGVRYDQTGAITGPRKVLDGGYISWQDLESGHWWQRMRYGGQDNIRDLGTPDYLAKAAPKKKSRARPQAVVLTLTEAIAFFHKRTETNEQRWQRETEELISKYRTTQVTTRRPWMELNPSTLEDLYNILNRISDTQLFVFRGHADREWKHLITSIHRALGQSATAAEQAKLEAEGITAFRRHGRSLLHHSELAYFDRILDGVTLMQHYGAPTRLLDWTLSPWVAAYFVVSEEAAKQADGVIWAFNQAQLVKGYFERLEAEKSEYQKFASFITAATAEEWLKGALEQTPVISTFRYQYANPQMGAQQSLFTICGTIDEHHETALERVLRNPWDKLKIVIPAKVKNTLRQRLFRMNVSALSLFPSVSGVGLHISEAIRCGFPLGDEGLLYLLEKKNP